MASVRPPSRNRALALREIGEKRLRRIIGRKVASASGTEYGTLPPRALAVAADIHEYPTDPLSADP
jgi:hypothetical protein